IPRAELERSHKPPPAGEECKAHSFCQRTSVLLLSASGAYPTRLWSSPEVCASPSGLRVKRRADVERRDTRGPSFPRSRPGLQPEHLWSLPVLVGTDEPVGCRALRRKHQEQTVGQPVPFDLI